MRSKEDFEEKRNVLKAKVRQAGDEEMGYDDLITDLTELFFVRRGYPKKSRECRKQLQVHYNTFLEPWQLESWREPSCSCRT